MSNPGFYPHEMKDGTKFIVHVVHKDKFVFEVKDHFIWSVTIESDNIKEYFELLGRGKKHPNQTVGEIPLDGDKAPVHDFVHGPIEISTGNHAHWGTLRKQGPDGATTLLPILSAKLGGGDVPNQILALAKKK